MASQRRVTHSRVGKKPHRDFNSVATEAVPPWRVRLEEHLRDATTNGLIENTVATSSPLHEVRLRFRDELIESDRQRRTRLNYKNARKQMRAQYGRGGWRLLASGADADTWKQFREIQANGRTKRKNPRSRFYAPRGGPFRRRFVEKVTELELWANFQKAETRNWVDRTAAGIPLRARPGRANFDWLYFTSKARSDAHARGNVFAAHKQNRQRALARLGRENMFGRVVIPRSERRRLKANGELLTVRQHVRLRCLQMLAHTKKAAWITVENVARGVINGTKMLAAEAVAGSFKDVRNVRVATSLVKTQTKALQNKAVELNAKRQARSVVRAATRESRRTETRAREHMRSETATRPTPIASPGVVKTPLPRIERQTSKDWDKTIFEDLAHRFRRDEVVERGFEAMSRLSSEKGGTSRDVRAVLQAQELVGATPGQGLTPGAIAALPTHVRSQYGLTGASKTHATVGL